MHRLVIPLAAAGIMIAGVGETTAAPIGGRPVSDAATHLGIVEDAQYFWGGRRWCWYDDGWQQAGWYWCGYNWRRGFGWGGGPGFHGWGRGGGRGGRGFGGRGFGGHGRGGHGGQRHPH